MQLRELTSQLPLANTVDNAFLLAELACFCHERLNNHAFQSKRWDGLDEEEAMRLRRFLRDANAGISNTADHLWCMKVIGESPLMLERP